jgi:hypothetical protein
MIYIVIGSVKILKAIKEIAFNILSTYSKPKAFLRAYSCDDAAQ